MKKHIHLRSGITVVGAGVGGGCVGLLKKPPKTNSMH